MIWVGLIFTLGVVSYGVIQKLQRREWLLTVGFLGFTLFGSVAVSFGLWPRLELLFWIRALFEPATKWLYAIL